MQKILRTQRWRDFAVNSLEMRTTVVGLIFSIPILSVWLSVHKLKIRQTSGCDHAKHNHLKEKMPLILSHLDCFKMMYQDAANDGFWYGYDDGAKLAYESDQENDEAARLDHSQGTNLSKNQRRSRNLEKGVYWNPTERQIKVCTWLREISSCSCLTVLLGSAWVLLSKTCKPIFAPL